jgi:Ca2+-binding RTX toxin-like protein
MATVNGTSGNDSLNGTSGNDTLNGLGGNDALAGSGGTDFYDGGTGSDTLDLRATSTGTTVSFASGVMGTFGGGFTGSFVNMERVLSGNGADSLIGGNGNQTLSSRGGNDTLAGGVGVDTLWGGSGVDSFVFRESGTANADSIADFASGSDKFVFDANAMSAIGANGNFAASDARFAANATGTAQDADDRVIYETDTRQVWYDPDGTGASARQLIATLQSGATLVATDIEVANGAGPGVFIVGTEANDSLVGGPRDDIIEGRGGNDTLEGLGGNDNLRGDNGADLMIGGEGNDTLESGSINPNGSGDPDPDTMDGGAGNDEYEVDNAADVLIESGGTDTVVAVEMDWTLASGFENLVLRNFITGGAFTGIGNEANNHMVVNFAGGRLEGLGGDDTLIGGGGAGEPGNVLLGGDGNDSIAGAFDSDTLDGGTGNDTLDGADGNDVLRGFEGADSLRGGAGNDTVWGFWELSEFESDFASDTLDGGVGDDEYNVNDDGDVILADSGGIDTVVAWNADWTLAGGLENLELESLIANGSGNALDNRITGAHEGGVLLGLGGSDTLIARGSENGTRMDGGAGVDTLVGATGMDIYVFSVAPGAANADTVVGFDASEEDRIVLDGAAMPALGASGRFSATDARYAENSAGTAQDSTDRVIYNTSNGELWYDPDGSGASQRLLIAMLDGPPDLAATDIEVVNGTTQPPSGNVINGTSGNDTLTGTAGNDQINGLGGNDLFLAGSTGGADTIDGGAGRDSIEFKDRATSAITVDFTTGSITGGSSGTISFAGIERIVATNFNDSLAGDAAAQTLTGQSGADTIAGAGAADTLWGGAGGDNFLFREMGTANADRISDFASGSDNLWLDDVVFTAIGADGRFGPEDARFKANSGGTATEADDRVIFNTSTGQLYYDADGSGAGAAQIIATVQSGATVAATDIVVF